jgi:hypothetical protein
VAGNEKRFELVNIGTPPSTAPCTISRTGRWIPYWIQLS